VAWCGETACEREGVTCLGPVGSVFLDQEQGFHLLGC